MADYLDQDRPPVCELHGVPMIRGRRSVEPDGTPGPWEWLCAATMGDVASIASDPARDGRRRAYADRERRRAARALDRYLDAATEPASRLPRVSLVDAAGESFIEAVGDYVLSRLHHNSDYGVADPALVEDEYDWRVGNE